MLPGETIGSGAPNKCDCGKKFRIRVLQSGGGYYIGTACENRDCSEYGMPYSRESLRYWQTREEAERALAGRFWIPR